MLSWCFFFVCSKALSCHKKWQWGIMQPTVAPWLFYATTTVCLLSIVMSLNRILRLVQNEINMKRKKKNMAGASIVFHSTCDFSSSVRLRPGEIFSLRRNLSWKDFGLLSMNEHTHATFSYLWWEHAGFPEAARGCRSPGCSTCSCASAKSSVCANSASCSDSPGKTGPTLLQRACRPADSASCPTAAVQKGQIKLKKFFFLNLLI